MSSTSRMNNLDFAAPPVAAVIQRRSLLIGGVFGLLGIIGAIVTPSQFFPAYLLGFMLWLGVSLGCLTFLLIQFLTGGSWGMVIRRILEAGSRSIWLMIPLFIPILCGMRKLYPWARPEEVVNDPHLRHITHLYLAPSLFILRSVCYFVAWGAIVLFVSRWSRSQDTPPDRDLAARFRGVAGPGLVVYGLTMTFAAIDWVMSLDPNWASTIFGMIFLVGQGLLGICIAVIAETILRKYPPMNRIIKPANLRDHGNLMLTFVMLWAYFSFSQWLIIWQANKADEITFYLPRVHHGWNLVGFLLMIFHFAVPFALLLSRDLKANPRLLAALAGWLILMRWLDLFWVIEPNFHKEHFFIGWLDFVIPIAMGGLWLALFFWNLRERPLVPLHDPRAHAILGPEM